jgi:hypothetical protein
VLDVDLKGRFGLRSSAKGRGGTLLERRRKSTTVAVVIEMRLWWWWDACQCLCARFVVIRAGRPFCASRIPRLAPGVLMGAFGREQDQI